MGTGSTIFFIGICIGIFLALRELWCWYFKLNEIKNELKKSNELLAEVNRHLKNIAPKDTNPI